VKKGRWHGSLSFFSISLFFLFLSSPLRAFNQHQPFDISADLIDYLDASRELTAEGHVTVVQTSSTLTADYVRYDRAAERLYARGHVILREKDALMAGDELDYDLAQEKGRLTSAKSYGPPWLFQAQSWEREKDYYIGRYTSFTSCELIDPHYHLRSSRVHFIPDRLFWAWNNRIYVDRIPVFYTPFLYKYLDKQRVVFQAQPGNDTVNGAFAKTATTIRITDRVYDRFLFDHYQIAGNGIGNEFDYSNSTNTLKGSLFGYYINPKGTPELVGAAEGPQYNIRSYHWQKINPSTTLQSNVNLRNNVAFNDQFFQEDYNQSITDINSSIALTQQKARFNQRLVVERMDAPDVGDTSPIAQPHIQSASLPRYDFTLFQKPIWTPSALPLVSGSTVAASSGAGRPPALLMLPNRKIGALNFSMNGTTGNTYFRQGDTTQANASSAFTFSQLVPISRDWSFTPSVIPQVNWQDKATPLPLPLPSTGTFVPLGQFSGTQGKIATSDLLRYRPFSSLTVDQTYLLTERMAPNGLGLDRSVSDGGTETNKVNWLVFWRPSRSVLLRSFSGYDLRRIADEDPNAYLQRKFDPWTTQITIDPPRSHFNYYFQHSLGFYPLRATLWDATVDYRGRYGTTLDTGLLYNSGQPGVLTWNNQIGVFLSPGWRVDLTVHAFVPDGSIHAASSGSTLIDSEFIVTRDLHCWNAQFIYRNLPPFARSYSILFNLKTGARAAKEITNQELESQFYPWRDGTYAR